MSDVRKPPIDVVSGRASGVPSPPADFVVATVTLPVFYDIQVDRWRAVTQADVDRWQAIARAYAQLRSKLLDLQVAMPLIPELRSA